MTVTSYAPDFGAVNSDAPFAVGAGNGFTSGRDSPPTQPTPHMRKRRAFHGHNLSHHAVVCNPFSRDRTSALSAPEKDILLMRYFRSMTQPEIGKELGVSQMQVSRLLAGVLAGLRASVHCDGV